MRTELMESASSLQGGLSCFKKAKTFQSWRSRAWEPHVLLADGREIKPCVEALVGAPPEKWPLLIAVLQSNPMHAARTRDWAASLPKRSIYTAVHVVESVEAFSALLRAKKGRKGRLGPRAAGWYSEPTAKVSPRAVTGDATRAHMTGGASVMGCASPGSLLLPVCAYGVVAMTGQSFLPVDFDVLTKMLIEAEPEVYED